MSDVSQASRHYGITVHSPISWVTHEPDKIGTFEIFLGQIIMNTKHLKGQSFVGFAINSFKTK